MSWCKGNLHSPAQVGDTCIHTRSHTHGRAIMTRGCKCIHNALAVRVGRRYVQTRKLLSLFSRSFHILALFLLHPFPPFSSSTLKFFCSVTNYCLSQGDLRRDCFLVPHFLFFLISSFLFSPLTVTSPCFFSSLFICLFSLILALFSLPLSTFLFSPSL